MSLTCTVSFVLFFDISADLWLCALGGVMVILLDLWVILVIKLYLLYYRGKLKLNEGMVDFD